MRITNVKGNLFAPDFKDGDKFYVVVKGEITAVKIKNSYIMIVYGRSILLYGEFVTPKCEWGEGYISISHNLSRMILNFEIFNNNRPFGSGFIYASIEDARRNNPYRGVISLTEMEILNKGEHVNINDASFSMYYWAYYSSENVPVKNEVNFYCFIRENEALKISKKTELMNLNYWASKEECQNAINKRLMRANVCDFDNDKKEPAKVEINLTINVSTDASKEEIINAVLKTLHKE